MKRPAPRPILALTLLLTLGQPALAASPEEVARAKQLSAAGAEAFRNKSFEEAIAAFEEANRLVPHPNLDVNIGRAYEALGQPDRALLHCKIALNAAGVPEPTRQAAQQCVERAQKALVRPVMTINSKPNGAVVRIDGVGVGTTPFRGEVEPGRRQIDIELEGFAVSTRTITVARGDVYPLEVTLSPANLGGVLTVTSVPSGAHIDLDHEEIGVTPLRNFQVDARSYHLEVSLPGYVSEVSSITIENGKLLERSVTLVPVGGFVEPPSPRPMWPAWTMLGLAAGGVGVGTYYGLEAYDAKQKADKIARTSGAAEDRPTYEKYTKAQDDDSTKSNIFFITSAVLVTGGLTWLLWPDPAAAAPESPPPAAQPPQDEPTDE